MLNEWAWGELYDEAARIELLMSDDDFMRIGGEIDKLLDRAMELARLAEEGDELKKEEE